jgi:uncharacterized protein (TIGR00255 family)
MNSMTGFGRAISPLAHSNVKVELSGVNRKQLELAISLPQLYSEWDQLIRPILRDAVSRGRVSISISFESNDSGETTLTLDENKLNACQKLLGRVEELTQTAPALTTADLLRLGILTESANVQETPEEAWPIVEATLKQALADFLAMRATEGENLKGDLLAKLSLLEEHRERIMELAPAVPERLREAMMKRLEDAGLPVDLGDDRLIREIAIFADKCDVTEETTRLASHFAQFRSLCDGDVPAGRSLDFLCQEIFREFNTIGSKANDATLAHLVVSAKTELEKIREQVQNIE